VTLAHHLGSDEGPGAAPFPTLFAERAFFWSTCVSTSKESWRTTSQQLFSVTLASKVNATGRIIE
jgi:hypothetical protein